MRQQYQSFVDRYSSRWFEAKVIRSVPADCPLMTTCGRYMTSTICRRRSTAWSGRGYYKCQCIFLYVGLTFDFTPFFYSFSLCADSNQQTRTVKFIFNFSEVSELIRTNVLLHKRTADFHERSYMRLVVQFMHQFTSIANRLQSRQFIWISQFEIFMLIGYIFVPPPLLCAGGIVFGLSVRAFVQRKSLPRYFINNLGNFTKFTVLYIWGQR